MKASEVFDGENSSLMRTFRNAVADEHQKTCTCSSKYCEHYKSDFDRFAEEHDKETLEFLSGLLK